MPSETIENQQHSVDPESTEMETEPTDEEKTESTDYDGAWKGIIQAYFPQFLLFFFKRIYNAIDWERGIEFLNSELLRVTQDAKVKTGRSADLLVKVWLKNGKEVCILLHIEVQSQHDPEFVYRLFVYNYRIHDQRQIEVITLAILADTSKSWRPNTYTTKRFGFKMEMTFPMVKLVDFKWKQLQQSTNPFALVVMAHRKAQETMHDPEQQMNAKFELMRWMYQQHYTKEEIKGLLTFLDWVLRAPEAQEKLFWEEVKEHERSYDMSYVWSLERIKKDEWFAEGKAEGEAEGEAKGEAKGKAEGLTKGLLSGIELGLELKFGERGIALIPEIAQIQDVAMLESIQKAIRTAQTVGEIQSIYRGQ